MYRIPFRKQLKLATLAAETAGVFRGVWKNTRKYQYWILKTYKRIKKVAVDRMIDIPEPLILMEEEK